MSNMNDLLKVHILTAVQESIEDRFSIKRSDAYIRKLIKENPDFQAKLKQGILLVHEYMQGQYYPAKQARVAQLKDFDLETLVTDIFVGVAYCLQPVLFTSVTAQLAGRLRFSDKAEAIATIAEIMAVLCQTDVFDITKADKMASLMVVSRINLSDEIVKCIEESQYLPPMVSQPALLENNYSSGYLTHNDSLILGVGNHHNGDICLDVLNLMNKTKLSLNTEFLETVEEKPTFELDTQDKTEQWNKFKAQSKTFYDLLIEQGNEFYLTHKVDKRGRIYAQGYHINPQGCAYKKAMVELAHKELVTGVP